MTNALDLYVTAQKEVHALDLPNKEAIEALTHTVMRMVAMDLQNNNIKGAVDTQARIKAMEDYIAAKVRQQEADLRTQNMIAALRLRTIREIGRWIIDNLDHSTRNEAGAGKYRYHQIGITETDGARWQMVAKIQEIDFENWLAPYLDGGVQKGMELYFSKLLSLAHPPSQTPKTPDQLPIAFTPAMAAIYRAARNLYEAIDAGIQDIGRGQTPIAQVRYLFDYLKKLPQKIADFKKQSSELY